MYLCISGIMTNFNPRSREGSDDGVDKVRQIKKKFQSALPRGERPQSFFYVPFAQIFQSALPRGERLPCTAILHFPVHFNPRSREGSDIASDRLKLSSIVFQSALPRGERRVAPVLIYPGTINFNPRSREGSDSIISSQATGRAYFNPRSREGSDVNAACTAESFPISIRAPARGATLVPSSMSSRSSNFNPRSREGSDVSALGCWS